MYFVRSFVRSSVRCFCIYVFRYFARPFCRSFLQYVFRSFVIYVFRPFRRSFLFLYVFI